MPECPSSGVAGGLPPRLGNQARFDPSRNCRGDFMIANDDELQGTRARIAYFEDLLAQLRVAASAELFPSMASGYRAEIEKMQHEVLEYHTRHVSQPAPAEVA